MQLSSKVILQRATFGKSGIGGSSWSARHRRVLLPAAWAGLLRGLIRGCSGVRNLFQRNVCLLSSAVSICHEPLFTCPTPPPASVQCHPTACCGNASATGGFDLSAVRSRRTRERGNSFHARRPPAFHRLAYSRMLGSSCCWNSRSRSFSFNQAWIEERAGHAWPQGRQSALPCRASGQASAARIGDYHRCRPGSLYDPRT